MTFKGTSEALNHIARVASASTRPHANGRIDLIPENAREPEEYYNTIRDQYLLLNDQHGRTRQRLTEIKIELRATLPFEAYRALNEERERLAAQYSALTPQLVELRSLVRATGKDAWAVTFYNIAKRIIGVDAFIKLETEVELLLGRKITEVAKGEGEMSDRARISTQRGDNLRQRRKQMRERQRRRAAVAEKRGADA